LTMTITGIFINTEGIYGSIVPGTNNPIVAGCRNSGSVNVTSGIFIENLSLGECWRLTANEDVFAKYGITIDNFAGYKRSIDEYELENAVFERSMNRDTSACNSLTFPFDEWCIGDSSILPVDPAAIASQNAITANQYNLATSVIFDLEMSVMSNNVVFDYEVSIPGWDLNAIPLKLHIQSRSGSSISDQLSSWTDVGLLVNVAQITQQGSVQISSGPLPNCTTFFAQIRAESSDSNSPWTSAVYKIGGSCIPSNNQPIPPPLTTGSTSATTTGSTTTGNVSSGSILQLSLLLLISAFLLL